MPRDVTYTLCLETEDSTLFLANIKLRHNDYSIYVEFQDSFKTELHIHTTGIVRTKNGDEVVQTIQVVDPLSTSELLAVASYTLTDLAILPSAGDLTPDEIILIPKEITHGTTRLAFALSRTAEVIPNLYSVAISLPEILTVNIAALSDSFPSEKYDGGHHPFLALTKINLSSARFDEAERYIENNQLIRAAMNPESPQLSTREVYFPPMMLRMPNSVGVWELIFEVPMRIAPRFSMQFVDLRFQAEDHKTTKTAFNKVSRKFKVLDTQTGEYLFGDLPPFELILDAEL